MPLHTTEKCPCTKNWELGQYVRVWRGGSVGEHDAGGYEYGHIETMEGWTRLDFDFHPHCHHCEEIAGKAQVMLTGDDGIEIYCQVKDLEEGE